MLSIFKLLDYLAIIHKINELGEGGILLSLISKIISLWVLLSQYKWRVTNPLCVAFPHCLLSR